MLEWASQIAQCKEPACQCRSHRRHRFDPRVEKLPWRRNWQLTPGMQSQKRQNDLSVCFQGKPFNITVIEAYAPTSNAEEAEGERFYKDLQNLLELTPQKRCPFHYRGLEWKSRKSRNTWSNRQIWSWSTEWSRAKANRVLPREHTDHSKHPLPRIQEKTLHMDITGWSTPKSD